MGFLHQGETNLTDIVRSIRELWQGRTLSGGEFTLTANAASTVVQAPNCGEGNRVFLIPRTAHAAAALATTYIDPDDVVRGQFTVQHANNSQTDRDFGYECRG